MFVTLQAPEALNNLIFYRESISPENDLITAMQQLLKMESPSSSPSPTSASEVHRKTRNSPNTKLIENPSSPTIQTHGKNDVRRSRSRSYSRSRSRSPSKHTSIETVSLIPSTSTSILKTKSIIDEKWKHKSHSNNKNHSSDRQQFENKQRKPVRCQKRKTFKINSLALVLDEPKEDPAAQTYFRMDSSTVDDIVLDNNDLQQNDLYIDANEVKIRRKSSSLIAAPNLDSSELSTELEDAHDIQHFVINENNNSFCLQSQMIADELQSQSRRNTVLATPVSSNHHPSYSPSQRQQPNQARNASVSLSVSVRSYRKSRELSESYIEEVNAQSRVLRGQQLREIRAIDEGDESAMIDTSKLVAQEFRENNRILEQIHKDHEQSVLDIIDYHRKAFIEPRKRKNASLQKLLPTLKKEQRLKEHLLLKEREEQENAQRQEQQRRRQQQQLQQKQQKEKEEQQQRQQQQQQQQQQQKEQALRIQRENERKLQAEQQQQQQKPPHSDSDEKAMTQEPGAQRIAPQNNSNGNGSGNGNEEKEWYVNEDAVYQRYQTAVQNYATYLKTVELLKRDRKQAYSNIKMRIGLMSKTICGTKQSITSTFSNFKSFLDGFDRQTQSNERIFALFKMTQSIVNDPKMKSPKLKKQKKASAYFLHSVLSVYAQEYVPIFRAVFIHECLFLCPFVHNELCTLHNNWLPSKRRCQLLGMRSVNEKQLASMANDKKAHLQIFDDGEPANANANANGSSKQNVFVFESEEDFLRRIKTQCSLFAELMAIPDAHNASILNVFGIDAGYCWAYCAQLLQMPACVYPEICAICSGIFPLLAYSLNEKYPTQFPKMVQYLAQAIISNGDVSTAARQTVVLQLKLFVDQCRNSAGKLQFAKPMQL